MSNKANNGKGAEIIVGVVADEILSCLVNCRTFVAGLKQAPSSSAASAAQELCQQIDDLLALQQETRELVHADDASAVVVKNEVKFKASDLAAQVTVSQQEMITPAAQDWHTCEHSGVTFRRSEKITPKGDVVTCADSGISFSQATGKIIV